MVVSFRGDVLDSAPSPEVQGQPLSGRRASPTTGRWRRQTAVVAVGSGVEGALAQARLPQGSPQGAERSVGHLRRRADGLRDPRADASGLTPAREEWARYGPLPTVLDPAPRLRCTARPRSPDALGSGTLRDHSGDRSRQVPSSRFSTSRCPGRPAPKPQPPFDPGSECSLNREVVCRRGRHDRVRPVFQNRARNRR